MRIHSRVTITVVSALLLLSMACGCKEGSVSAENSAAQSQTRYICPMHPQVLSEKKESCAICGMDLVPVTPDRAPPSAGHLADRTTVQVAPESARLIGVRTTRVEKRPMVITVRSGAKAKIDPAFSISFNSTRKLYRSPCPRRPRINWVCAPITRH